MISLFKDIWTWLTTQAFHQILVAILICILGFLVLLKYPIEFERTVYRVKQNVTVTETTQYILSSVLTENKAKLNLCTKTYFVEVRKENDN